MSRVIVGFSGARNSAHYLEKYNIRFVGHDSAVAILIDGKLAYAAEEERFNREKHTSELPGRALLNGLAYCDLKPGDIHCFAFPWKLNPAKIIKTGANHLVTIPFRLWPSIGKSGFGVIRDAMSAKNNVEALKRQLKISVQAEVIAVDHHISHITSSYACSGFEDAAVLSIDGSGGYLSLLAGTYTQGRFIPTQSVRSPHSLGIVYSLITEFLGFRSGYDEYKVMGMAAYGNPVKYAEQFEQLIRPSGHGFQTKYTGLILNLPFCLSSIEKIFGLPKRSAGLELTQVHFDIAAALQKCVEDQIFNVIQYLRTKTSSDNLCLSGGVFQNSVVNGKILLSGIFKNVFIPPVPGDSGTAVGAAIFAHRSLCTAKKINYKGNLAYLGPDYSESDYLIALQQFNHQIDFHRSATACNHAAGLIAQNKIIGWFNGRMEYGPRALGNRSILALPAKKGMMDRVNILIKNREAFRPFAAAVVAEKAADYFQIGQESPYMQFVVPVREDKIARLQAISHFGTCRIQSVDEGQNPVFHQLLVEVGALTGDPVLLNTSFNGKDEPIVCDPVQAVQTFLKLNLDALIIGNFIVTRK